MKDLRITAGGMPWSGAAFGKIIIYGNGKILFERDNLDAFEMRQNGRGVETLSEKYCGGPVSFTLAGEIKTARKENLNRKDNYTLTYSPEYLRWEKRTALYIHESEIAVDDLGEVLAMETADEKCYLHAVRLHFRGPVTFDHLNIEYIPCEGNWKIPGKGRWSSCYGTVEVPCYEVYDCTDSKYAERRERGKGVVKRWVSSETVNDAVIMSAFRTYTRIEYSEDRKRRCRIAEKCKAAGLRDFSYYDVEKLEKALGLVLEG